MTYLDQFLNEIKEKVKKQGQNPSGIDREESDDGHSGDKDITDDEDDDSAAVANNQSGLPAMLY